MSSIPTSSSSSLSFAPTSASRSRVSARPVDSVTVTATVTPPPTGTSQSDWSRNVAPGQLIQIDELVAMKQHGEVLPVAVRIIGQLDSYDANGDASRDLLEKFSSNAHDSTFGHSNECMDTDADVADDDGTTRPSNLGVAVLRYRDARLSVDTSLLSQQDSSFGAATDLPSTGVQFEINHWYQVIGDICYTQHTPPQVYVRARVCRRLDDSFDVELYEETIKLRRVMEARR